MLVYLFQYAVLVVFQYVWFLWWHRNFMFELSNVFEYPAMQDLKWLVRSFDYGDSEFVLVVVGCVGCAGGE